MKHEIRYGKAQISVYRTNARPLEGVPPIPESGFTRRDNTILGAEVTVDVFGDNFLPAYTEGDNRNVVATDTMKNFTYAMALEYTGSTQEGFAAHLARMFLSHYPQMKRIRVRSRELPFQRYSEKLLSPTSDDHGFVDLEMETGELLSFHAGRRGLKLVKLTGSSFASFARDQYTTLPERPDRPLFIHLDVAWRYSDPIPALADEPAGYVPSEQVADLVRSTFDGFISLSIQHLVNEMGHRILERFPALAEVSLEAQNRLWDTSAEGETVKTRVYSDPKPAHGSIGLRLTRD